MPGPSDNERARMHRLAGAGFEFTGTVVVTLFGGLLLDRWLGTKPVFLLIGLCVGFAVALYKLIQLSRQ